MTSSVDGDSGIMTINADEIDIRDRGSIKALTSGAGKAGEIEVQANSLFISGDGASAFSGISSAFTGISSDADRGSSGDAGTLTLEVDTIELLDGGVIGSSTLGEGDAGNKCDQAKGQEYCGFVEDHEYRCTVIAHIIFEVIEQGAVAHGNIHQGKDGGGKQC